ncbi:MAG: COQ9 family protein [Kiloniellales bacterium]|nr:COQ9 family protein [Kiloniellales bacterium]MDJ0972057.1 COQ9 family protein [Kiloniellales bacterium]
MDIESTRRRLLDATLNHVPFDGWTMTALQRAAADLDLDAATAVNAFPGGAAELIAFHSAEADRRMLDALQPLDLPGMRVRDRIAAAVRLRLEQNTAHREAIRRALAFLALPQNGPLGLKCLYRTVDAMWYAAGDTSTDYNFYTKRLLLSGVYSSTLLFWLNDESEDFAETWAFLSRRIDEVLKIGGNLGKGVKSLLDLPDRMFRFRPGSMRR